MFLLSHCIEAFFRRPCDVYRILADGVEVMGDIAFRVIVDVESVAALEGVEEYPMRSYSRGAVIVNPSWLLIPRG